MQRGDLAVRGEQMLAQGLTPLRALRRLRREYPQAEHFDLHVAVGLGPTGVHPLWAQIGNPIRPVICRIDPRKG
jgi:hypothetical protein